MMTRWASLMLLAASTAAAQTHVVIVSGLGGYKKYHDTFIKISQTIATAANT